VKNFTKYASLYFLLSFVALTTGCSSGRIAQEWAAKDAYKEQVRVNRLLHENGMDHTLGSSPYNEYLKSGYAKTNDIEGFIKSRKQQEQDGVNAYYKRLKDEHSGRVAKTVDCLMEKGSATSDYSYLKSISAACVKTVVPFEPMKYSLLSSWEAEMDNIAKDAADKVAPHFAEMEYQQVMRLNKEFDRQKKAANAAAKRAYDNSMESLVE